MQFFRFRIQTMQCKLCHGQNGDQYLYTVCHHLVCLSCCYIHTDFASSKLKCCGISTAVDQDTMSQIIRNKKHNRKTIQFQHIQHSVSDFREEMRSLSQSRQKNNDLYRGSRWKDFKPAASQNYPIAAMISSENPQNFSTPTYNGQSSSGSKFQTRDFCQLENILLLQIEKVKKQFNLEHENLRKKQDHLIKQLMNAYEDEIKNIERPIMTAKLQNFNLSMGRFNDRIKKNIRVNQEPEEDLKQNQKGKTQTNSQYDHIIKKLEMNQQRMSQKIQRHLHSLN